MSTQNLELSLALNFVNFVPFICLICNMQVVVKASDIFHKDTEVPPCGVDDMTKLAYLHEPGVLNNLRSRYDINEIYVRISVPNSNNIASVAWRERHHPIFIY
jgi:hypothetical protein